MGLIIGTGNNSAKKHKDVQGKGLVKEFGVGLTTGRLQGKKSTNNARKDNARDLGRGNDGIYDRYRKELGQRARKDKAKSLGKDTA